MGTRLVNSWVTQTNSDPVGFPEQRAALRQSGREVGRHTVSSPSACMDMAGCRGPDRCDDCSVRSRLSGDGCGFAAGCVDCCTRGSLPIELSRTGATGTARIAAEAERSLIRRHVDVFPGG